MPAYSAAHFITLFSPRHDPGPSKILRPRSIPAWTQLTWEWAQCSLPVDVTSLLHLAPPPPLLPAPPRATTQHVC